MLTLMKCSIMLHFIWVFTVCQSIRLGVFSIQRNIKPDGKIHKYSKGLNCEINEYFIRYCSAESGIFYLVKTPTYCGYDIEQNGTWDQL